ncbi:MAG: shikimate kinase [Candidatus Saccharibacteria bacterium]
MEKNIVLIGFMGTGKTAIGTRLAQRLNRKFIDTDREIERVTGMTVRDIFLKAGEVRFRSEEALISQKLANQEGLVIATGGGLVLNPENIEYLRENGVVVCLKAAPEDIFRRVSKKKQNRPLLGRSFTIDDIVRMLNDRDEFYRNADIEVDTTGTEPDMVVQEIISKLQGVEGWTG